MARLLLLTDDLAPSAEILPALGLLGHHVRTLPAEAAAVIEAPAVDVVLVDARTELVQARSLCRVLSATGTGAPVIAILTEGGLTAVTAEWSVDDVVVEGAGPAEVEARLRLVLTRAALDEDDDSAKIVVGELVIDEHAYSAKVGGTTLDLTYKEFELLKQLATYPGRVFTRAQLLQEVWGYDYFGGTRTVDVHVRRLRAKLGPENEAFIGTVRNVGYRFAGPRDARGGDADGADADDDGDAARSGAAAEKDATADA